MFTLKSKIYSHLLLAVTFSTLTSMQLLQEDFRKAASPITASECKRKMFYGQNRFFFFLSRAQHL